MNTLIYHTFFKEFSGASAEEVVKKLYENSEEVLGITFEEWWDYQKKVWKLKYGLGIPETPQVKNAAATLLSILTQVGALEVGPKPPARHIGTDRPERGR